MPMKYILGWTRMKWWYSVHHGITVRNIPLPWKSAFYQNLRCNLRRFFILRKTIRIGEIAWNFCKVFHGGDVCWEMRRFRCTRARRTRIEDGSNWTLPLGPNLRKFGRFQKLQSSSKYCFLDFALICPGGAN